MQMEDLAKHLRMRPFRPFRVCLTDGVAYEIRHPEMMMVGKRVAVIGLARNPEEIYFEKSIDVDLFHIIRVEPLEVTTPPNGPQS